jgi:hypothetical protein
LLAHESSLPAIVRFILLANRLKHRPAGAQLAHRAKATRRTQNLMGDRMGTSKFIDINRRKLHFIEGAKTDLT